MSIIKKLTVEEKKRKKAEYSKKYYEKNKSKILKQMIKYRDNTIKHDKKIKIKKDIKDIKDIVRQPGKMLQAEIDGSLFYDLKILKWIYNCPVCQKKTISTTKNNAMSCRKCNPQKVNKSSVVYWPIELDEIIDNFNKIEDQEIRNKIYIEKLKYPFEKLVENVFNTFKFSYFETGPVEIQQECVNHLVMNVHKFDVSRGTKSFSYFSIIAKNFLIALNNSTYKRFNTHDTISCDPDSVEGRSIESKLVKISPHYDQKNTMLLVEKLIEYFDNNIKIIFKKEKEIKIAEAINEMLRQHHRIEEFNKKAIYLMIREISNCKTCQITKIINKMICHYRRLCKEWIITGDIDVQSYSFGQKVENNICQNINT